ncbi:MAG: hypothetical protein Q4B70_01010 [Lachnospiraceae bacterium]|nr:hypothetical protein [Lachnospiraceae bacterium]
MSDLKPVGIPIQLGGEERRFLFTLNAMDELQSKYDMPMEEVINGLLDKKKSITALRDIVMVLINDEVRRKKHDGENTREEFTLEEVGWMIHAENVTEITFAVLAAYGYSLPEPDEFESPNAMTGQ